MNILGGAVGITNGYNNGDNRLELWLCIAAFFSGTAPKFTSVTILYSMCKVSKDNGNRTTTSDTAFHSSKLATKGYQVLPPKKMPYGFPT